ncbi:MAG: PadR family transcriptional regulator [Terracidiphilus sp.]|jgi:DNA-binding PadR family transcriptional regulator
MNSASTLEFALVGLLRQKAQSGYDLRKTFTETAMRHYSDSPGSIYPALKRLRARGWIEAEPKDSRGREVFHLSNEGVTALAEWLSRDIKREDVVFRVAELMLRFAFMDGNVPRSTTTRFLEQFQLELGIYVRELRGRFERTCFQKPVHTGLLAFQHGVEAMEAQLSWAQKARRTLEEDVR